MIANSIQLLTSLHSELKDLNGFIGVAPADSTYPLVTYTVINSSISPVQSFTTKGNLFTVQFSYFDDTSFLGCLNLAKSVEDILSSFSDVLRVDEGNIQMVANTNKDKLFQVIDTRVFNIVKDITPVPTYTLTYNGNGNDGGTVPVDTESPYDTGSTVTVLGNTGNLSKTGYSFDRWNTLENGTGIDYAEDDTFTITANIILFAKWTLNEPINYIWTGSTDGDYENPLNYTPNGIPTEIDTVEINDTATNMPTTGTLTCNTITLINNTNGFGVDVNYGELTHVVANTVVLSPYTRNINIYPINVNMYGYSINNGVINIANMFPIYEENTFYPENTGTIVISNCYWNEGEYDPTGTGTIETINYMGAD